MAHLRGADGSTGANLRPIKTRKGEAYDVCWRDDDGRFRQRRFYGSRRAADKEVARIITEKVKGTLPDDRKGRLTFAEVAAEWLDTLTKPKPQTVATYRRLLFGLDGAPSRTALTLGSQRVNTIRKSDLGKLVNSMKVETVIRGSTFGPLRPNSMQRVMWPVGAVLRFAASEGYIARAPEMPPLPEERSMDLDPFEHRPLEVEEVDRLAAEAERLDPMFGLVVRVLCFTGVRSAELAGLNVGDVALLHRDGPHLTIRRTRTLTGGAWREGKPKSRNSTRSVPLVADLVEPLAAYLAAHPRRGEEGAPLFYGRKPGGNHLDRDPATPFDPGTFYKRTWQPVARRLGIVRPDGTPPRLHDARHTAASLWIASGESLTVVSRILGHANVTTTETIYVGLLRGSGAAAATRLGGFLDAARASAPAGEVVVPLPQRLAT